MKSVEQVLTEAPPATVNYRTTNNRHTLRDLIDSVPQNNLESDSTPKKGIHENVPEKLNWKNGVLIPCLLNIWGVIMFLRLGWVVGQAGIWLGTLVIVSANVVTTITALSMCAICTNGEVKGGGVYFLISRALGPVFGGCIGILFFVAQAVATSLYIVGFGEGIVSLMGDLGQEPFTGSAINDIRVIGIVTAVVLLLVALNGIGWYAKCQIGLLVILVVAMISVMIGAFFPEIPSVEKNIEAGFEGFELRNFEPNFQTDPDAPNVSQTFFTVFAVFFPAVTGIMAGANISGDLKDPSKAIPKGTLVAIVVSFISYILLLWFIGLTCVNCVGPYCPKDGAVATPEFFKDENYTTIEGGLLYNKLIMKNVSLWEPLVYIGVFAATLSSALASLVGAPRILQSVASDELFPWRWFNYFGKGVGASNEPIRAYFLTFFICCACVSIGSLDAIAPLISNFFIVSYAMTNYACFSSSASKAVGWRPSFRYYNKWLSLFGAIICIVVMFLISWSTSIITCIIAFLIYKYLLYINPSANWGAAGEAKKYLNALQAVETLQSEKEHVKTFKPQFLVLTGPLHERAWLVKFTSLLQKSRGLMICADIVTPTPGRVSADADPEYKAMATSNELAITIPDDLSSTGNLTFDDESKHVEKASALGSRFELSRDRRQLGETFLSNPDIWDRRCPGAFCESIIAPTIYEGFVSLLQTSGLGRMRPNTVILGFKHDWKLDSLEVVANYERMIRLSLSAHLGLLVVRDDNALLDLNMKDVKKNNFSVRNWNCCHKKAPGKDNLSNESMESGDHGGSSVNGTASVSGVGSLNGASSVSLEAGSIKSTDTGAIPSDDTRTLMRRKRRGTHKQHSCKIKRMEVERTLPVTLPGNRIDVWWITDDGGLTMLLPHLLTQNPAFKQHSMRVLAVGSQNAAEHVKFQETERKMAHLLNKFRIKAQVHGVEMNWDLPIEPETISRFEGLGIQLDQLNNEERLKTNFQLRLSELVRKYSSDASIIFIILPIPDTGLRVRLFCSWLDMLSDNMPPMVMMRGNNENVLTFLC